MTVQSMIALALATAVGAVPDIELSNGVMMPAIACGSGGNNNTGAGAIVAAAFAAGFKHIDTAHDYGDQAGVGEALKAKARTDYFLTTKVPGCGVPTQGLQPPCFDNTVRLVQDDLSKLGLEYADLMLIHFPPLRGCVPENCEHMQQQWTALEQVYAAGQAKAIGVSNYCKECLQCILQNATVTPMVNQMQYHVGIGSPDFGSGLLDFCAQNNITFEAYSPLGGGKLLKPDSKFMAAAANLTSKYKYTLANGTLVPVSAAQIALAWIAQKRASLPQLGLVTKSSNLEYLEEDLAVFSDWVPGPLSDEDRAPLDAFASDPTFECHTEAPGGCCK